jgi:arylsulfatase A-like enzyme
MGGDTSQYYPDLVSDNHRTVPPNAAAGVSPHRRSRRSRAIEMIADVKQVVPKKPFFLYFCTGAQHAPHQVPKEWADRYKGKFDDGWDAYRDKVFQRQKKLGILPPNTRLSPRDPDVPPWDSRSADEWRLYARMMEVYAGFLEHSDHHFGRLIDYLEASGQLGNTLIMVMSDNGASPEGGPHGSINENLFFNNVEEKFEDNIKAIDELGGPRYFNHYPWGWAWAGNVPFRRWKRETYRGGYSDPFIVHWPAGIKAKGEVRQQFAHVIDMVPTVLDALHVQPPVAIRGVTQSTIEAVSFAHVFDAPAAMCRAT